MPVDEKQGFAERERALREPYPPPTTGHKQLQSCAIHIASLHRLWPQCRRVTTLETWYKGPSASHELSAASLSAARRELPLSSVTPRQTQSRPTSTTRHTRPANSRESPPYPLENQPTPLPPLPFYTALKRKETTTHQARPRHILPHSENQPRSPLPDATKFPVAAGTVGAPWRRRRSFS